MAILPRQRVNCKGSGLPFLGPTKLLYSDGWPKGDVLDNTAEGSIDDFHFLPPTGNLHLKVMSMAITNGTEIPFAAAAVLINP